MSEDIVKLILEAIDAGGAEATKIIALVYGAQLLKLCVGMGTIVFVVKTVVKALQPKENAK